MLASSICPQISAEELTAVANRVQSETFRSVETYVLVAAAHLLMSLLMRAVSWLVAPTVGFMVQIVKNTSLASAIGFAAASALAP